MYVGVGSGVISDLTQKLAEGSDPSVTVSLNLSGFPCPAFEGEAEVVFLGDVGLRQAMDTLRAAVAHRDSLSAGEATFETWQACYALPGKNKSPQGEKRGIKQSPHYLSNYN